MLNNSHVSLIISSFDDPDRKFLHELYFKSFPPEERRPWDMLLKSADDSNHPLSLLKIIDSENRTAGFMTRWHLSGFTYIEHFAINPQMRGCGIGAAAMSALIAAEGRTPVVLEAEPADNGDVYPMAQRRIAFYRRLGFIDFPQFEYFQPPYSPALPKVKLTLMSTSADIDLEMISSIIHHQVYGI